MTSNDATPNAPLAETLGLPVVPTYGSRYADASWGAHLVWRCRTCDVEVTDRYYHELSHRATHWIYDVDRLYETVSALFREVS